VTVDVPPVRGDGGRRQHRQDAVLHNDVSTRYVGFAGFSAEDHDSDSPEASRAASFASSHGISPGAEDASNSEATLPAAPKNWFALQWRKWKEMRREMNRNPDYALHIALVMDRATFWFVFASYIVIIIVIFAVGSQEQTTVTYQ